MSDYRLRDTIGHLLNGKAEPSPIKEPPWARIPRPMPIDFHMENPLEKARAEIYQRMANNERSLSAAVVELVRKYQRAAERVEVLEAERAGSQGDDMGGQLRTAALRGVAEIAVQLRNIKLPAEQKPRSLGEKLAEERAQATPAPQPEPSEEKPPRLRDLILRHAARLALRLVFGKTGDDLKRVRRG